MISYEKARQIKKNKTLLFAIDRKFVGSNSILCWFLQVVDVKEMSGIRDRLKQDQECKGNFKANSGNSHSTGMSRSKIF